MVGGARAVPHAQPLLHNGRLNNQIPAVVGVNQHFDARVPVHAEHLGHAFFLFMIQFFK